MCVLESPERESYKKYVNVEFLKGIWEFLLDLAEITSDNADND
jgi:hypothetical protein